jgi:Mg-chelatase subunit ChlD
MMKQFLSLFGSASADDHVQQQQQQQYPQCRPSLPRDASDHSDTESDYDSSAEQGDKNASADARPTLSPSDGIQVTPLTLYPAYTTSQVDKTTACVHIVAPQASADDELSRSNLDLCAVIDVSGSMGGSKLTLAKEALQFILRNLKASDRFSLVSYASDVKTELSLRKMDSAGKAKARRVVERLATRGCTNLSGGLFKGIEIMQKRRRPNPVGSIMLMTDGLANEGIQDVNAISKATRDLMGETPNYSLYTFGYGADHDSNMLKNLSEVGNGMYYFVETNDMIPESFAHCLGGLLTVQAQNIKLTLTVAGGVELIKVESDKEVRTLTANTSVEVDLSDMQAEEQRDVVFHFKLDKSVEDASQIVATATLNYLDVPSASFQEKQCVFNVHRTAEPGEQTANETVQGQVNRIEAADAMRRAMEEAEHGRFESARAMMHACTSQITSADHYSSALRTEMAECAELFDESNWQQKGLHDVNARFQSHSRQRENVTMASRGFSAYSSPSKSAYYKRAKGLSS